MNDNPYDSSIAEHNLYGVELYINSRLIDTWPVGTQLGHVMIEYALQLTGSFEMGSDGHIIWEVASTRK